MTDTLIPQALQDAVADAAGADHTVSIAYSGGLDSRFLAFVSKFLGYRVRLLHVAGPHMAPSETAQAVADARAMGIEPELITANPLGITDLASAGKTAATSVSTMSLRSFSPAPPTKSSATAPTRTTSASTAPGERPWRSSGFIRLWPKPGSGKRKSVQRQQNSRCPGPIRPRAPVF